MCAILCYEKPSPIETITSMFNKTKPQMPSFDAKFFLNMDLENPNTDMDSTIQTVFPNEIIIQSKENSNYVQKLREQMAKFDSL